jgi:hypothetical protein
MDRIDNPTEDLDCKRIADDENGARHPQLAAILDSRNSAT